MALTQMMLSTQLTHETEPLIDSQNLPDCVQDADDDQDGLGIRSVEFYQWDCMRYCLSMMGSVLTCGFLLLVFRWSPILALQWKHRRCHRKVASKVLVHSTDSQYTVVDICKATAAAGADMLLPRCFYFRNLRYFERDCTDSFTPMAFKSAQTYWSLLKVSTEGLSLSEVSIRRGLFGQNLAEVPVKSHVQLLLDEVLHPFYIFQVWSVVVWYLEPYILYATTIAIISIISALFSLFSTRRNLLSIQAMAQFSCQVTVLRRRSDSTANCDGTGQRQRICSTQLVPGDVVEIEDGVVFPCDLVLCSGNTVVNEAMLTGESLPVLKTAIPVCHDTRYDAESDKRFTLFAGTKAMEARRMGGHRVLAIVLRTGFATAKGRLVRSILYPKASSLQFYADSFKFVGVMALFAILGFLWSIAAFIKYNVDLRDVILNACDVVTIAVPPALPAAMTIGTEFAIERLKKYKIFCISPNRVNICGQLDLVCFDKTGTLTEEGVDVMGVLPTDHTRVDDLTGVEQAPARLMECLACCHALTTVKGELIGDPLDLKMFAATGWTLHEAPEDQRHDSIQPPRVCPPVPTPSDSRASSVSGGLSADRMRRESDGSNDPDVIDFAKKWAEQQGLAIIKKFDFTSNHQRMSVIARNDHQKGSHVFLKGAPEVVRDLCDPSSIPPNFTQVVQGYTRQGLRLLACAHAYHPTMSWHKAEKISRDTAEQGLQMVGILMLENRLKAESAPVIAELNRAGIRCCMVTGDHVLTAVTVSRNCGIIHATRPVLVTELVSVSHQDSLQHHPHAMRMRQESAPTARWPAAAPENERCEAMSGTKHSHSSIDLWHQGLEGMTGAGKSRGGYRMVHSSQPSDQASVTQQQRLELHHSAAAAAHDAAAHEAAGGLEVQGGSLTHSDALSPTRDLMGRGLVEAQAVSPQLSPSISNGGGVLSGLAAASSHCISPVPLAHGHGAHGTETKHMTETKDKTESKAVRFRLLEPEKGWGQYLTGFKHTSAGCGRTALAPAAHPHAEYLSLDDLVYVTQSALGAADGRQEDGRQQETADMQDTADIRQQQTPATLSPERREHMDFEVAVTGPAFGHLMLLHRQGNPSGLQAVTDVARIFARMSPEQKQALVETYGEGHGLTVGMCGDGANDCGALKAAHVGLSLSEAEASIAAPFTSSTPNIAPLLTLMREGRAALVTSISCFKFMALYSSIQFITVLRLYQVNTNMSDMQYLWIDLCIIFPLAVTMGRTEAYATLSRYKPNGRLISFPVLSSVLGQTVIAGCFQAVAAWWTFQVVAFHCDDTCPGSALVAHMGGLLEEGEASWCDATQGYDMPACCFDVPLGCGTRPIVEDTDDNILSFEATTAFLFSQFQYLSVVIAFNRSKPYRRSLVTNFWFFSCFIVLTGLSTLLLVLPDDMIQQVCRVLSTLEISPFANKLFKFKLLGLACVNSVVTYLYESAVEKMSQKVDSGKYSVRKAVGVLGLALITVLSIICAPVVLLPSIRYT